MHVAEYYSIRIAEFLKDYWLQHGAVGFIYKVASKYKYGCNSMWFVSPTVSSCTTLWSICLWLDFIIIITVTVVPFCCCPFHSPVWEIILYVQWAQYLLTFSRAKSPLINDPLFSTCGLPLFLRVHHFVLVDLIYKENFSPSSLSSNFNALSPGLPSLDFALAETAYLHVKNWVHPVGWQEHLILTCYLCFSLL